jgi:O-antigen/teichoic acid export membrane protein
LLSEVILEGTQPDRTPGATAAAVRSTAPEPDGVGLGDEAREVRSIARGGALNLVGVFASGALQFLLVIAVTRGLGARDAGTFLEAVALFTILGHMAELGATTGLVRTVSRYRTLHRTDDIRTTLLVAFVPVVAFGVVAAAAVFAFAPQLAAVFFHGAHRGEAATYLRLLAPFLPLASATTVALAATRGFGGMVAYVGVQNIGLPALRLCLVALAVVGGLGSVAIALGWTTPLVPSLLAGVVALVGLLRRTERAASASQPRRPPRKLVREFWRFTAPRALAGILGITVTWFDILLVGALRSTKEAAIYAAASRLSIIGAYALQAVGMAIAPQISGLLAQHKLRRVEDVYRIATWWLMALGYPIYWVMITFAPLVMRLFGPEFVAGSLPLAILSLAMLVNLGTGNVNIVLLMGGRSSWNMLNAAVSLALNIALNLVLIPSFGITGAAVAWSVSLLWVNLAPLVQVRRFMGLKPPFGSGYRLIVLASGLCYGVLGLAARAAFGVSATSFVLYGLVATALYLALVWRFRVLLRLRELREAFSVRGGRRPATAHAGS